MDRPLPAIDLLGPGRPVLWGITYRFVTQLVAFLGHQIPPMPSAYRFLY
jgi:hypothetical protein